MLAASVFMTLSKSAALTSTPLGADLILESVGAQDFTSIGKDQTSLAHCRKWKSTSRFATRAYDGRSGECNDQTDGLSTLTTHAQTELARLTGVVARGGPHPTYGHGRGRFGLGLAT